MTTNAARWQRARSRFNHDWLRNRFLVTVGSFLSSVSGEGYQVEDSLPRPLEVMLQWPDRRAMLEELLQGFEKSMSPAAWFDLTPLNRLDSETRQWLAPVAHLLWWKGRRNEELLGAICKARQRADEQHARLLAELDQSSGEPDIAALERVAREMYAEFQCLSETIHRLP